jgi:hypothetical protein
MTEQAADRFVCGKIQDVDEVVPTGIEKQGMLVGPEFLGMDAEVLVDGPNLHVAVAERRDPELHADLAVVGANVCWRSMTSTLKGRMGNSSIASWADRDAAEARHHPTIAIAPHSRPVHLCAMTPVVSAESFG